MKESIKKLLDIADKSYYNYKKQGRPIIALLEKYFDKEDLEEFLETGKIKKFEKLDFFNIHGSSMVRGFFDEYYSDVFKTDVFLYTIFPAFIQTESVYNKRSLTKFIVETELDIDKTSALLEIAPLSDHEIKFLVNMHKTFIIIPEIVEEKMDGVIKYKVDNKSFDSLDEAKDYIRRKELQKIVEGEQPQATLSLG